MLILLCAIAIGTRQTASGGTSGLPASLIPASRTATVAPPPIIAPLGARSVIPWPLALSPGSGSAPVAGSVAVPSPSSPYKTSGHSGGQTNHPRASVTTELAHGTDEGIRHASARREDSIKRAESNLGDDILPPTVDLSDVEFAPHKTAARIRHVREQGTF